MNWKSKIESIGIKVPVKIVATRELIDKLNIPCLEKFELLTGIRERRACSPGEDSCSLAVDAAIDCLDHSKYNPEDLEMIISCSITKYNGHLIHQYEPPLSVCIKNSIGASGALNFDITNACAGMQTGIFIAEDFIRRGVVNNCMIVSGEYITSLMDHAMKTVKTPFSKELASLTLGDAGAAVILDRTTSEREGIVVSGFTTLSKYSHLCIGKHGRKYAGGFMRTMAKKIHKVSISDSVPMVKEVLKKSDLTFDQIDYVIPHQTSRNSIFSGANHYAKCFGQRPGQVVVNLKEYGNTASTSHFLAMYSYLNEKRFKEGDRIMLLCFASGIIIGVVLFIMNEMVNRYGNKN